MKIGLIDVDGHSNFPNVALMKLSGWHKGRGDSVGWANGLEEYDRIYMAKVFTFTPDDLQAYQTKELVCGGTGYDLTSKLPEEVERSFPDYALYGIKNKAYGYLTRGCPRGCPFCVVKSKEGGHSHKVADLSQWWDGQKEIVLLDPNITACPDWDDLIEQLIGSQAWVDFTQGLDIRLMTDKKASDINKLKIRMLHFAWDNPDDLTARDMLKKFADKIDLDARHKRVYVLCNFNSTHEQDLMRVELIKKMGYDPYIMIYDKPNAPRITRLLQRYVNNKFIFRRVPSFSEYDPRARKE